VVHTKLWMCTARTIEPTSERLKLNLSESWHYRPQRLKLNLSESLSHLVRHRMLKLSEIKRDFQDGNEKIARYD
jgi:hypothetical protein